MCLLLRLLWLLIVTCDRGWLEWRPLQQLLRLNCCNSIVAGLQQCVTAVGQGQQLSGVLLPEPIREHK